ncbi:MAG: hypothetical protein E7055_18740 [Lentisphaerae bacterium]|jgi:hypothetical protein|nr:hypothetical protein [Lentisphaerota bacterium]MBO4631517.1 cellulase family glycosylhydrolase [Lentisphaeria bacterium]
MSAQQRFIDISKIDDHYFADKSGKTWIPIGCNLCFFRDSEQYPEETILATYEEWLTCFAAAGGNFVRIWLGVPFFDVMPRKAGEYDAKITNRIRCLIALCEKLGIKIKFTFEHFRKIVSATQEAESFQGVVRFDKPIYRDLATSMSEYFASGKCREIYLDRARWFAGQGFGDSPAVIAWELWNEINCTAPMNEVALWSDYMIAELQKIFPKQMIVQNLGSFSGPGAYQLYDYLSQVRDNGFLQAHRYLDPGAEIEVCTGPMDILCSDVIRELRERNGNIPVILAETGAVEACHRCYSHLYEKDIEGTLLHDGIFAPFFSGSAGCGQFWHWDHLYIHKHRLWYHFARFAEAVKGLDPAAEHFKPFHTSTKRTRVYGLIGEKTIIFWVRDKASSWQSELEEGKPAETISGESLTVYGNDQVCDCYLPWENRHESVRQKNGICEFPDFKRSLVVRFTR